MRLQQAGTAWRVWREKGVSGIATVVLTKLAARGLAKGKGLVPEVWTEHMSWLSFAIPGMLCRGNAYCFDYALRNLPSAAPIVEIGSFCGLSTNMLAHLKEKHGRGNKLITCDRWLFEGADEAGRMLADSKSITCGEYRSFIRDTFIRNARFFSRSDLPFTIEMLSDELFAAWDRNDDVSDVFDRDIRLGGAISFAFIDGNHTYEFARRDFENCDRHLESGGFLLLDDSADTSGFEVCRVAHEICQNGRYELLDRNPHYFFRKK